MEEDHVPAILLEAPSELGTRIRAVRLRKGIGLRELARRLELSPSLISQIETGKIRPSVRTLYALSAEFGVTTDELLFDQSQATQDGGSTPGADAAVPVVEPGLVV